MFELMAWLLLEGCSLKRCLPRQEQSPERSASFLA